MRRNFRFIVEGLYQGLLSLYPPRFRATFGEEIQGIFMRITDEAEAAGDFELLALYFYELKSLAASIISEHWHELKSGKENKMSPENDLQNLQSLPGDGAPVTMVVIPAKGWILRWTLLMPAAIVAGWLLMSPFTALLLFIYKLGENIGVFSGAGGEILQPFGLFAGLALTYSTSQWLMLRNYLPCARSWFLSTLAGFLVAGILVGIVTLHLNNLILDPLWLSTGYFLLVGATLGLAQWGALRKIINNAYWILVIDVLAVGSFLLSGSSFTSFIETLFFLLLPGLVTGIGIWKMLEGSQPIVGGKERVTSPNTIAPRIKIWPWIIAGLVSLVPLFFLYSWFHAISHIQLAKNEGIYATPQEAVIASNSQGWGGAEVVRLENVHASPNRWDGTQPHVWFGVCTVYLDRIPVGWDRTQYGAGSYYIHVREGWVHVPEGAFPEYIGWVMELYDLEGVKEWAMENK